MFRALLAAAVLCAPTAARSQSPAAQDTTPDQTAVIRALEQQMWDDWRERRFDAMRSRLMPDARFVGDAGMQTRDEAMAAMRADRCDVTSASLQDVDVALPRPDVAIITYRMRTEGTCDGRPIPSPSGVNTSTWMRQAGEWKTVFHGWWPLPHG